MSSSEITELPLIAPRPRARPPVADNPRYRGPERRACPRLEVELECEERVGDSRYFRITSDLSTFGLSTRHGFVYQRGKRVQLRLHLPDGQPDSVDVDAEVVAQYRSGSGMRLAFRNPSVETVRRIHRFLAARAGR